MPVVPPVHQSQPSEAPTAIVRILTREDVMWNRPIFKAPPLDVVPPVADFSELGIIARKPGEAA